MKTLFFYSRNVFCVTQLRRRREIKKKLCLLFWGETVFCSVLWIFFIISRGTTATRRCPVKSIAQSMVVEVLIYLLSVFGSCMLMKHLCLTFLYVVVVVVCSLGHTQRTKQASSSSSATTTTTLCSSSFSRAHSVFFPLLLCARGHKKNAK